MRKKNFGKERSSRSDERRSIQLIDCGFIDLKAQTRKMAEEKNLPVAQKPDSQEICFVPNNNNYQKFLPKRKSDAKNQKVINAKLSYCVIIDKLKFTQKEG